MPRRCLSLFKNGRPFRKEASLLRFPNIKPGLSRVPSALRRVSKGLCFSYSSSSNSRSCRRPRNAAFEQPLVAPPACDRKRGDVAGSDLDGVTSFAGWRPERLHQCHPIGALFAMTRQECNSGHIGPPEQPPGKAGQIDQGYGGKGLDDTASSLQARIAAAKERRCAEDHAESGLVMCEISRPRNEVEAFAARLESRLRTGSSPSRGSSPPPEAPRRVADDDIEFSQSRLCR